MQTRLAVFIGKTIAYFSRLLNLGGGSAAPGLYALRIDPNLIEKLTKKIPKNIVITGTNGKTTTSRMIAHFAKATGLKVIRNHTGSNLERGIASALIHQSSIINHQSTDLGIWELDEAAFNSVAPKIKPDLVVFLNVSRDQLDRYGEVDKVVNDWCQTLKSLPKTTTLIINSDDKNLAKLPSSFAGKTIKFSLPKNIKLHGLRGSEFKLYIVHSTFSISLPLPGLYHVYDAIAALSVATELKLPLKNCIRSLRNFKPAFGRVEKLEWGFIMLIKNPAGATSVFETIAPQIGKGDRLLLALNDNLADGTDVSWIWDGEFEKLKIVNCKLKIVCSGSRAYELANRLKYAGFNPDNITVQQDLKKAFLEARSGLKGHLFVLPTYTAMLELQRILAKSGAKSHYWKEEA